MSNKLPSTFQPGITTTWLVCGLVFAVLSLFGAAHAQQTDVGPNKAPAGTEVQNNGQQIASDLVYEGGVLIARGTSASLENAVKKFEEALLIWRKSGDHFHEAVTLGWIGKAYDLLGEKQKALDVYLRALAILHQLGRPLDEASTMNNIGLIYYSHGEQRKALWFYERSLAVLSKTVDKGIEGITLVNIGLAYVALGEKQKALSYYHRALSIMRTSGDDHSEAVTLNNLGLLYNSLGEREKALEYFGQALPLIRARQDRRLEAVTLNNIGYVYDLLGKKPNALDYYKQALPFLRAYGDKFTEAATLNNIGLLYTSSGQFKFALNYFNETLALRRTIGDRPGEALTLSDAGTVYDALGQTPVALKFYNDSLRISREVEDKEVEASTLRRLAILNENRGNFTEALSQMEAALTIIEVLRSKITTDDLRSTYFASVHEHFETYISLLMRMHRKEPSRGLDALALKASERARARSLLEMLVEAKAEIREGVAPALLERANILQQELRDAAEKQTRVLAEKPSTQQLIAIRRKIENALTEYQQVEAEIRTASPRYAALTQPVPLSVKEIQNQVLDQNTVLLEYSLGEKKSFLWAVTPSAIESFELAPRIEIENAALAVYALLTARNKQIKFETAEEKSARIAKADKDFFVAASRLSNLLLRPVAARLGKKRLLFVGDGVLDYVPFAALPGAGSQTQATYQPLIVDHEVVSLPSASTLALLRRELAGRTPADKTLAVIADPVFDKDDPRINPTKNEKRPETRIAFGLGSASDTGSSISAAQLSTPTQDGVRIQRLPFTRIEAESILKLVPEVESEKALDFDADREFAINPDLGKYRYVHFATHGILNSQFPELSGLVLSLVNRDGTDKDGYLWANDVYNLRLPVEMIVLSGCRTGLGKEIRGEGLVGLTRGFMYAGAKRVVVSLWDISDEASANLMTQFYKGILGKEQLRPVAALRSAQIAIWKNQRWQAPYYWAAFIIQGEVN